MVGGESARRYARALANIAERQNTLDAVGEELSVFSSAFEGSKELQVLLKNPKFAKEKQLEILGQVLDSSGTSDLIKNFIDSKYKLTWPFFKIYDISDIF